MNLETVKTCFDSFVLCLLFATPLSLSFLTSLNSVARSEVAIAAEGCVRRGSSSGCDLSKIYRAVSFVE